MVLTAEKTLLVASCAPASNAEALEARAFLANLPPSAAVELRLDAMNEEPAFGALRAGFESRKLIATVRSAAEGGAFRGNEEDEKRLLGAALAAGFDLIDVEYRGGARPTLPDFPPSKQILSFHDTEGIPADLAGLAARMLATPAAYVKVVALANDSRDALRLIELQAANPGRRLAAFGMGEAGIATRVVGPYLGSALAYGALVPGQTTAPGQLLAQDLVEIYGVGRARFVSRAFFLLGGVVSHSLSPAIHNANFEALGQDALYVPLAMRMLGREFEPLVAAFDALGLPAIAASVTIPFKEEAALLPAAAEYGEKSVNTLLRASSPGEPLRLRVENTDRDAFEAVIEDAFGEKWKTEGKGGAGVALVLGAGGTARVAVSVLRKMGWVVFISNRTEARGEALAKELGARALSLKPGAPLLEPRIIVNATALGLHAGDAFPCERGLIRPGVLVVDAPYRAGGTDLVKASHAAGARVVDGQTLLLLQAARQAKLYTGVATTPQQLVSHLSPRLHSLFASFEEFSP